ncbi:hypothetical protein PHMEG_0009740 [Phytophthora megakarya]|uniref:MULE transposase domain-containing protein n=1 Tax=Phytophthora megakarya TaxID=4795 RepID=A0A225WHX0_9STRA|nr:hypothetical protein PHMEG_0009740 [Phytophthora megakarya]
MTSAMKMYVQERLNSNRSITAHILFTEFAVKVKTKEMQGPAPKKDQVRGFFKRWREKDRDDSMQPVEEMGAQFIRENGQIVPDLGDASDEYPFRMALTSFSLLEAYTEVQQDPRCTTILHVDSTFNMVRQKYSVFILGISDSCGHYFPLYVMTDADKAQHKALSATLPSTTILMCSFHVTQHIEKTVKSSLERIESWFFVTSMTYIVAEMKVNSLSGSCKLEGSGSPSQHLALDFE